MIIPPVFVGEEGSSVFTVAACLWLEAQAGAPICFHKCQIKRIDEHFVFISCLCEWTAAAEAVQQSSETLISSPLASMTRFLSFYRCWSAFPRWRSSPLPRDLLQVREQLCPFDSHRSVVSHLARVIYLQPSLPTEKVIKGAFLKSFCHFCIFPLSQKMKHGQSVKKKKVLIKKNLPSWKQEFLIFNNWFIVWGSPNLPLRAS